MLNIADAVEHRVTHVEVAAGQVNLGAKGVLSFLKFAVSHALEQIQAFLNGPVTPGADGRPGGIAPVLLELLRGQLAHIGEALPDQLQRILVGLLKIIGAVEEPVTPVKAQPVDVLLDGVHILGVFLGGVGVIHAQVADTAEAFGSTEINGQGLAVADVEVAVRLRREAGVYLHTVAAVPLREILLHKSVNKISGGFVHLFHLLNFIRPHYKR